MASFAALRGQVRRFRLRIAQAVVSCLLLAASAGLALAAPPGPPPLRDYAVDAWSTRTGLPHNSVRDMAQTAEGYLWFATWEGVVRYNGLDFVPFQRGTEPGLRDNGVGALYLDPQQRLWLSDSRGNLGRLREDGGWDYLERAPQWPRVLIHDMAMDGQGRLWLLFEGHGLGLVAADGSMDYIEPPPGIPLQASFARMAIDAAGNVWIGTLDGLVQRSADGRWHRYGLAEGLPAGLVWPYLADDGTLWLAAGERVFRQARDGGFRLAHELPGAGHFTSMLQDREGNLWLGTENRGLARIGPHGREWLPPEQLIAGRIASLLEDAEGGIWIGANGGLFRLRETLFTGWTRFDGLGGDYVRALLEDEAGTLWVGGGGGLDRLGPDGRFHPVPLAAGNAERPSILSLALGADGDLWAGTFADGVFRLRQGRRVQHTAATKAFPAGMCVPLPWVPTAGSGSAAAAGWW
jgi:ligand-binding sensor domain-containing protein